MTVNNLFNNYIPKFIVELNRANEDIRFVSTSYFDVNGDVYEFDARTINPLIIQTTQSLQEIRPEVSTTFPFKIVIPLDVDGANVLQVPTTFGPPTAGVGVRLTATLFVVAVTVPKLLRVIVSD
jgi:hypothetical protein